MTIINNSDRRIDLLNNLDTRVSVLESEHIETVRARLSHADIISKLNQRDNEITLALQSIGDKFDALIGKFSSGFKILCVFCTILCTSVAAFWIWSHDLDNKYQPKIERMITATESTSTQSKKNAVILNGVYEDTQQSQQDIKDTQNDIHDTQNDVEQSKTDINKINSKRVIRASK